MARQNENLSTAEFEALRFEQWYALPSGEIMLCRLASDRAPDDAPSGAAWEFTPSTNGPSITTEHVWVVN